MKILLINDNAVPVGGAETYTVNLRNGLRSLGHEVRVLTSDHNITKNSFADYTFKGLDLNSPFRIFSYIFNVSAYKKLKEVLEEFQPDVVHLQYIFYHTSPSILLLLRNTPTLLTLHSHDLLAPVGIPGIAKCTHGEYQYCIRCMGIFRYLGEKVKRVILFSNIRAIDKIISPSKYFMRLHKNLRLKNMIQVYNGIEHFDFAEIKKKNELLFVGRLTKEKGVQILLEALHIVKRTIPDVHLNIVGVGPDHDYFVKLAQKLYISENVTFHGKQDRKTLDKYYENSTVVVVPSVEAENLPTVCIEAMSVGRPIIGADTGGISEMIEDMKSGIIYQSNSKDILAKNIIMLLQHERLQKSMSKAARDLSKKFSIENHLHSIVELYEKSINRR